MRLVPECSATTEPYPRCHTCGISGWPSPPPCGSNRLCPVLPSLQEHLQIYTDPRLHETWTSFTRLKWPPSSCVLMDNVFSLLKSVWVIFILYIKDIHNNVGAFVVIVSPLEHDSLGELPAELSCWQRVSRVSEEGVSAQRDVVGFPTRCLTGELAVIQE